MAISKPLLTPAEAAAVAGCSERSIYVWARDNKISAVKQAGNTFVLKDSLEAYLEKRNAIVPR